jgi:hypothetical protein
VQKTSINGENLSMAPFFTCIVGNESTKSKYINIINYVVIVSG